MLAWRRTVYLSRTSTLSMVSKRAAKKLVADGGVFDAHEVELHRLGIELAAVVKQHALAQPEGPGGELFVGLPALGKAGHDVAPLIDIGQAVIHRGRGLVDVMLILNMRVEAGNIGVRAILQGAAPLRMPRAGGRRLDEAEGGHAGERSTSGDEKFTSRKLEFPVSPSSGHR